ncbi:MAG: antibiotic biosynthesis monooxygenase [Rhodospirillaceae bacterium]|nr:antibiotic biosynthesis monooxygenase [Rhodospirillaceae bacterium]|tara:strand:+ start:366 stop:668 length:303 start_codon:yes stop_codon:yes gene_type:complete
MYVAINRFKIILGRENDFEKIWHGRDIHLDKVPGFIEFHLLKSKNNAKHALYTSQSTWISEDDFSNWTKSDSFRQAHKGADRHSDIYLGHPKFEGFEVIM